MQYMQTCIRSTEFLIPYGIDHPYRLGALIACYLYLVMYVQHVLSIKQQY